MFKILAHIEPTIPKIDPRLLITKETSRIIKYNAIEKSTWKVVVSYFSIYRFIISASKLNWSPSSSSPFYFLVLSYSVFRFYYF